MSANPTGMVFHAYMTQLALVLGLAFGALWALVPLALGLVILLTTA